MRTLLLIARLWLVVRWRQLENRYLRAKIWWMRVLRDRCTSCGGCGYSGVDERGKVRACCRCRGSGKFLKVWE